jgi:hypothetical protein
VVLPESALPGGHELSADALLAGPRGRSLCVDLLDGRLTTPGGRVRREWSAACSSALRGDAKRCASELRECVRIADLPGSPFDGGALMASLQSAVDDASYWDEPDAQDKTFADAAARQALRPVAQAVAVACVSDVRWWAEPLDGGRQRYTQFADGQDPLQQPQLGGAAALARAWKEGTLEDERSGRAWPRDPSVFYSGRWWSSPALSGLPVTTRRLPSLGAAGLALVEDADGHGWELARCWPVAPQDGARVYEISGPEQWVGLVERYPLEVTRSRRADWRPTTGWAGRWMIPDYAAAAADWDAIHLSVAGYLTTAGIPLPIGADARTMLAGWDPDANWWLTNVLSFTCPPEDWQEDEDAPLGWIQVQQRRQTQNTG